MKVKGSRFRERLLERFPESARGADELGIDARALSRGRELLRTLAEIESGVVGVGEGEGKKAFLSEEVKEELVGLVERERRQRVYGSLLYWRDEDFQILRHYDYFDGLISGLVEREERRYWFVMMEDYFGDAPRAFMVLEVSPEALAEDDLRHAEFRLFVGEHTDYLKDGKELVWVRSEELHSLYFDKYPPGRSTVDLTEAPFVAWFEF